MAESFGSAERPGLVVCHEWWGLNDDIRALSRRFADAGFDVVAVDLYERPATTDPKVAATYATEMKTARAMELVADAVAALRARGSAKVGATGFCLGGGMAIAAACNVKGIDAGVPFYGTPRDEWLRFGPHTPPLLGHYAKVDGHVTPERVRKIAADAAAAGASFEVCWYDGPHAFMRASDPKVFHAASAALAWERTLAFLRQHLG